MEILGWVGMTLVVVAYYPQIHHLYAERCAWGKGARGMEGAGEENRWTNVP